MTSREDQVDIKRVHEVTKLTSREDTYRQLKVGKSQVEVLRVEGEHSRVS